jgi:Protein of unknown function (DUF4446)
VLGVAVLVELVLAIWLIVAWRRLRRRVDGLTRGQDGVDLSTVLDRHLDRVAAMSTEVDRLGVRTAAVEDQGRLAIQRVGLVRFNPFEDTGGNQSFALAMLDANLDGLVLSSLHARAGTRVYAKALSGGRSATQLSTEEAEALRIAMGGRREA